MKLILVDSHTALIPSMRSYNPGHELRASIVEHALLVEALQWLFEAVWDASVPIMTSFSADHDPRRQMLVSLLMTGSTDSAIANTLNINVRRCAAGFLNSWTSWASRPDCSSARHWCDRMACAGEA